VDGKVKEVTTLGLLIQVTDLVLGFLSDAHLSDHHAFGAELRDGFKVGQEVKGLLVLRCNVSKMELVLTAKQSLCQAAKDGKFPTEFDQIEKGQIYPVRLFSPHQDCTSSLPAE